MFTHKIYEIDHAEPSLRFPSISFFISFQERLDFLLTLKLILPLIKKVSKRLTMIKRSFSKFAFCFINLGICGYEKSVNVLEKVKYFFGVICTFECAHDNLIYFVSMFVKKSFCNQGKFSLSSIRSRFISANIYIHIIFIYYICIYIYKYIYIYTYIYIYLGIDK